MASNKRKYYVVWVGREPGVYDTWEEAEDQIINFPGAKFKSFPSQSAAIAAFRGDDAANLRSIINLARRQPVNVDYSSFPEIDTTAWAVDASCMGNPGIMEYQGVEIATGRQIFHAGPFQKGTNNIGEYLAIVHALALMLREGTPRTIYSDSVTAQGWIRAGHARTKLPLTPETAKLLSLVQRADTWLATHTFRAPIRKWQTELWGEIPADFGRK